MKKMCKFMKAVMLTLMASVMLLGSNVITANAQPILPECMEVTEDGRIKDICQHGGSELLDSSERYWNHTASGHPYCFIKEEVIIEKNGRVVTTYERYFDSYLSDYIKTHDESEWPDGVIKGSDGVPFFYSSCTDYEDNYDVYERYFDYYYVKFCYDEKTDMWLQDKSYKGPYTDGFGSGHFGLDKIMSIEDLTEQTKEAIENGEEINGTAVNPVPPPYPDKLVDSETGEPIEPFNPVDPSEPIDPSNPVDPADPSEPVDPPTEGEDIRDPYADENTLGATVTLSTDCIKVKTNKKGVVAQKPMPKSVKVNNKALKKNKTFVVSYEKYDNGWHATDAVMDEGIYRLVITGQNGYEGVYKKRLYVTADKTIKAMSSAAVKVNKIPYSGKPITSGVIKSVKSGKRVLEEGTDYTVVYKNNLDSGTGQVTLTAIEGSGFLGTKTVNFSITGNKMNKVKVTGLKALVYDPNTEMVQNMSDVQLTYAGSQLVDGTDFTFAYTNNVKAGTAKITFTGKGLYNGTLNKTFKITKMPLNDGMLDEASKNIELTYTGKAQKPEVKLTVGGTELKKGTDYTLAYSNNVKVSTEEKPAWITVKGKGNYSGSFKVAFTIVPEDNDNAVKPNTTSILSTKEVPEEDDTVSGNSVEDETPAEDDTVSGNDIEDEAPTEDETPVEEETSVADDTPATDETPVDETPVVDETTEEAPTEDEVSDTVSGNDLVEEITEDEAVEDESEEAVETESEDIIIEDEELVVEEISEEESDEAIILSVGMLGDLDDYEQYFKSYDEKAGKNRNFDNADDAADEATKYVEDGEDGFYAVIMSQGKIVYGLIKLDGNIIKLNINFR